MHKLKVGYLVQYKNIYSIKLSGLLVLKGWKKII